MRRARSHDGIRLLNGFATRALLATAALALAVGGCGATGAGEPKVDTAELVDGNTEFALDLYRRVAGQTEVAANVFMSPRSVSSALAMTYAGARGGTADEMADALGLPATDPAAVLSAFGQLDRRLEARAETSGYVLNQANGLWGQSGYPFREEFTTLVSEKMGAGFNTVDFVNDSEGARERINTWVENATNDRIEDLIPRGALDASTVLVLANAIYFKGDWRTKFDAEDTRDAPFFSPAGESTVDMMHRVDRYGYFEDEVAQVLDLPYEGGDLSMTVVLPRGEKPGDLESLESSLTPEVLDGWIRGVNEKKVDVYLPRFSIEWGTEELKDDLMALGMKEAFQPGEADFSGIGGEQELFISLVLHKAFVEVNEEGSEAAAATAVGIARTSIPEPPPVFRADRPFLFMIRDRVSGSILFMGRLATP